MSKKFFIKEIFLSGLAGVVLVGPTVEIPKGTPGCDGIFCPRQEPYLPLHHDHLPETSHGQGPPRVAFTGIGSTTRYVSVFDTAFGTDSLMVR